MGQQGDYRAGSGDPVSYWPIKIGHGYELLTCFLLREFDGKTNAFVETICQNTAANRLQSTTGSFTSNKGRDLITFGQGLFYTGFGTGANDTTLDRLTFINSNEATFGLTSSNPGLSDFNNQTGYSDLDNLIQQQFPMELKVNVGPGSTNPSNRIVQSNVKIETTPKIINPNTFAGAIGINLPSSPFSGGAAVFKWSGQSSNQSFIANSRNFANSSAGLKNPEVLKFLTKGGDPGEHIEAVVSDFENQVSPQILLPKDKLIFGVQSDFRASEFQSDFNGIEIPAGIDIKISLYGSYIREEKRITNSFNQLLGTHTVYESIGSENVLDSFNVEYMNSFTGSYSDNVISGSSDPATIYEGYDFVTRDQLASSRNLHPPGMPRRGQAE